jgi:hypothetical protein
MGSSNPTGYFLQLGALEPGCEVVVNELTFKNVHNVSYNIPNSSGDYIFSTATFIENWSPGFFLYHDDVPLNDHVFDYLPAEARYDSFLLFPKFFSTSLIPRITEIHSGPVETNDFSNPVGLVMSDPYMVAGVGNVSASFTVASDFTTFAYIMDTGSYEYPHDNPRAYVTMDITVNGERYLWKNQPVGWIESAAPLPNPDAGNVDFGNVRIGTTEMRNPQVGTYEGYDVGMWPESIMDDGDFHELGRFDFAYTPTDHGEDIGMLGHCFYVWPPYPPETPVEAYVTGEGFTAYLDCTGRGVGPIFEGEAEINTTIDFGDIPPDSFFDVFFEISNVTEDEELGELTQLGFWAEITGEDANLFGIVGDDTGVLLVGESVELQLRFQGEGIACTNTYDANLIIHTDIGAEAGAIDLGEFYTYAMSATTVPEPSTLVALLGLGLMGLAVLTKHQR